MSAVIDLFKDELKRYTLFLIISAVSLITSFFYGDRMIIDPAWIAIILCGVPIFKDAIIGMVTKFDIKADVLVAMAIIASIALGEYFAAGEVAFIMAIGGLLEDYSAAKSNAGIEKLIKMIPSTGRVVRDGKECIVPSEDIRVGETIIILAGEVIPVDGKVSFGTTSIDQAVITGESIPVDKKVGDPVYSGTINQMGTFNMISTELSVDSSLQRMTEMVNSADADKTKIVRLADRWASYLVVIVAALALITYIFSGSVERAVTVMIVFCPCAFILATPTAIVAAIGNAAKHGILVRNGDGLEKMSQVDLVVFDKTGTLTTGKPAVSEIRSFVHDFTDDDIFSYIASAEMRSEHPLGKAVVSSYRRRFSREPDNPSYFEMKAGSGISAMVSGKKVLIGKRTFMSEEGIAVPDNIIEIMKESSNKGFIFIFVAIDLKAVGYVVLSDVVRDGIGDTIDDIRSCGAECMLLTGDNEYAASYVADKVNITEVKANCTPEDKMDVIFECQSEGSHVCMVGDGVNDAPALKRAWVGIAMGGTGSGIAVDAADMALVGDDISKIPFLQMLSKKMMSKISLNIVFSLCWNFFAVALAMLGTIGPVGGALIHNVGSVLVVVNSALLLIYSRHSEYQRADITNTYREEISG
ncbi:MAG: cation-translocating P-type ATPase [Candidatus Methanomethylophilaceae archaeon]|nr:cadmium-translocating P-type ATPase [Candidatus Methanomethylophilaceae archaeon]MDY0224659.1 cation-translocating P-type ATPase [Candidatus Methanomethylophilaceae archaeon]